MNLKDGLFLDERWNSLVTFAAHVCRHSFPTPRQVISEAFSEEEMPSAKVAEMFAEADWDSSGRVRTRDSY